MDKRREVSDKKPSEIIVEVETSTNDSVNRNLSNLQFGQPYTEIDVFTC